MRRSSALSVVALAILVCVTGCGSAGKKLTGPPKVLSIQLQSKLMGREMSDVLVMPADGGKGRPLMVFLHGYGAAPSDMVDPAFLAALRGLGDRAPVVFLPEGDIGWWHDRAEGPWGSYILREAIPQALARSGADSHHVAIGGISMGGFGALNFGRVHPRRFCAVGGHSPAVFRREAEDIGGAFDNERDFARHDLIRITRKESPYDAPVWIDIGNRDQLRPGAAALAHELKADGTDVSFHVWPGSHDGRYWDAHFGDYLRFYADACS